MASVLKVDKLDPQSGTALEIGTSGDTITVPSGATFAVSGTMNASSITAGTLAIAQGGTGAATLAAAGLDNNPSFSAERSTAQVISDSVRTTVLFDNEYYDSDSAYNPSNGRFTPQTAGKYFVTSNCRLDGDANSNYHTGFIELYKNGSEIVSEAVMDDSDNYGRVRSVSVGAIVDLNGSSDYFSVTAYIQHETTESPQVNSASTFQAFRVIGA
jgi:hypothetical protein